MLKEIKENRKYFIINLDESYAPKIFQVLKEEEMKAGRWPEGDITFEQWIFDTYGQEGLDYLKFNKV